MKRKGISFILYCVEMFIIIKNYNYMQTLLPILSKVPETALDQIMVSVMAAVILGWTTKINHFLVDVMDKGADVIIRIYAKVCRLEENIDNCIQRSGAALFMPKVKWGPTKNSAVLKIANTAEGLMGLLSLYRTGGEFSDTELKEIKKIVRHLITLNSVRGYKSYNIDIYTTTCTGMALYIIKKYYEEGIIDLTREEEADLRKTVNQLLDNAGEWGWGNENKKTDDIRMTRMVSTFWALRALNVWGLSSNIKYKSVLSNLLNQVPSGEFGFCADSNTGKTSMIAMFLVLIKEIENKRVADNILKKLGKRRISKLVKLLVDDLRTDIEIEEYLTDLEKYEKLSWTHLSGLWAIGAISGYSTYLSKWSHIKTIHKVHNVVEKQFDRDGFYYCEKLNAKEGDPMMYPTVYALMALTEFKKNMISRSKVEL